MSPLFRKRVETETGFLVNQVTIIIAVGITLNDLDAFWSLRFLEPQEVLALLPSVLHLNKYQETRLRLQSVKGRKELVVATQSQTLALSSARNFFIVLSPSSFPLPALTNGLILSGL